MILRFAARNRGVAHASEAWFGTGVPSALEIVQVEVGLLQNFCEVIGCPVTGRAALVDLLLLALAARTDVDRTITAALNFATFCCRSFLVL